MRAFRTSGSKWLQVAAICSGQMPQAEKKSLTQAILVMTTCLLITAVALLGAADTSGAARWALLFAALIWVSIGITGWLMLLSPHGWFGFIGREINRFLEED